MQQYNEEVSLMKWIIICGTGLALSLVLVGSIAGWFSDASATAQKEFGVSALLKKYEWFKDASAQLDAKQADIGVYQSRIDGLKAEYPDTPRTKWAREDREQYSIWSSEVAGIRASFNGLAADYNSEMSKANWAFTNVGQLPRGAEKPLPREYKPYETGTK